MKHASNVALANVVVFLLFQILSNKTAATPDWEWSVPPTMYWVCLLCAHGIGLLMYRLGQQASGD